MSEIKTSAKGVNYAGPYTLQMKKRVCSEAILMRIPHAHADVQDISLKIGRYNIPYGLESKKPKSELTLNNEELDALIRYNNIWHTGILNFPDFPMSESGRIHFEEVKKVFSIFEYGALILIPLSAAEIIAAKKKRFGSLFAAAGIISVGIPAALGLLIAANWEWVFITFHKLVFQNDYWLFDPYTDPVITILPDEFFMHCAALIMILVLAGSLAFFAAWKKLAKKKVK